MLQSEEVRKLRSQFRESKNHKFLKPSSLISSSEDKTVLFNIAGMQPLVPYLSGKVHPDGNRLYNIQRCIRTNDIDEVGDNTHCTFFEMMGNWSLGDYFKKEALLWSIEFLTEKLGLEFDKLGFTIFGGKTGNKSDSFLSYDKEAKNILLSRGVKEENIQLVYMIEGKKCDNFWGPAGNIGPCGPSCEIYYDKGSDFGKDDKDFVGNDKRYVEIRNNVFMQYYKDKDGKLSLLKSKNIDTGMGLERLMTFLQGKKSVYETDLFVPIIECLKKIINYNGDINKDFKIVVEHLRSVVFLLGDGVIPSNEGRGYVARRLLRRMWFHLKQLNNNISNSMKEDITDLVESVVKKYGYYYKHLIDNKKDIISILIDEIEKFEETLKKGEEKILKELKRFKKDDTLQKNIKKRLFSGEFVFKLYDTYGFPVDLTRDLANKNGYNIDEEGFKEEMKKAKERSKKGSGKMFSKKVDWASYLEGIKPTKFLGYDTLEIDNFKIIKDFEVDGQRILIFDKTPFYAEGGGQIGDKGVFVDEKGNEFNIIDVKKYDGVFLHFVK